jgi:hypothetical protein
VAGSNFTLSVPDWREGTYENFKDWGVKQFGVKEVDSDDEPEVPVHMMKAKLIEFERNGNGELILPAMTEFKTVKQKQRVIRGYLGAVYRWLFQSISLFFSDLNGR